MQKKDWLRRENCNTKMCKSCIFREDGNALPLEPGRMDEIRHYLATFQSHQCHTTKRTCYGALQYTAQIMYRASIIPEESVDSLLDTAASLLFNP